MFSSCWFYTDWKPAHLLFHSQSLKCCTCTFMDQVHRQAPLHHSPAQQHAVKEAITHWLGLIYSFHSPAHCTPPFIHEMHPKMIKRHLEPIHYYRSVHVPDKRWSATWRVCSVTPMDSCHRQTGASIQSNSPHRMNGSLNSSRDILPQSQIQSMLRRAVGRPTLK